MVQARSLKVAGNAMDEAIMRYVRRQHGLVIGESNAERIKIEAGTALAQPNGRQVEIHIKGRDLREGRLKSVVLGPRDMAEALSGPVGEMAEFIQRALEDLPPEIADDGGQARHRADRRRRAARPAGRGAARSASACASWCRTARCTASSRARAAVLEQLGERQHLLIGP